MQSPDKSHDDCGKTIPSRHVGIELANRPGYFKRPGHPYTRELLRSTITLATDGLHSIPGAPPDLVSPPSGCHFHPRCPDAMTACPLREPAMLSRDGRPVGVGTNDVACWAANPAGLSEAERAPLPREELSVADEA